MADCCSKYCSRWTLPSLLWSVVSVVSAILCSVGVYFSNWLQHETNAGLYNSISSFRLCVNQSSQISISCESYFTFNDISSTEWQAVTLIMGAGACFLVFTALLSLFVICGYNFFTKCSTCVLATLQSVGGKLHNRLAVTARANHNVNIMLCALLFVMVYIYIPVLKYGTVRLYNIVHGGFIPLRFTVQIISSLCMCMYKLKYIHSV